MLQSYWANNGMHMTNFSLQSWLGIAVNYISALLKTFDVTLLLFSLKPVDNFVDVHKEVCVRMRTNPRKVKRPVIKKWCYVLTEESG